MSLPVDYKPMVKRAIDEALPRRLELKPGMICHDANRFVLGALGAWAFGDEAEGLKRLELAYRAHTKPELKPCRSCGVLIRWTRTDADKPMPVGEAGQTHFVDCPQSKEWSGKSRKELEGRP